MNEATEAFNADEFLGNANEGEFATKYELVAAREYQGAILTRVGDARIVTPADKPPFASVNLFFQLNDEEQRIALNRQTLEVRAQFNLDIDMIDGKPRIAAGRNRNVRLGRFLESLGLNGKPWNWNMVVGTGPWTVVVEHQPDKKDPTKGPYENVARFTLER